MKHFFMSTLIAASSSVIANSAPATMSEDKSVFEELRESPFSLSLATETETKRRDGENNISAYHSNIYPSFKYSVLENTSLHFYPKFMVKRETAGERDYYTQLGYFAYRVDQNNILTQDDHGLDLNLSLRYYQNMGRTRDESKTNGYWNLRAYPNIKVTDQFAVNNEFRLYVYNTRYGKNVDTSGATRNVTYLKSTPTYSFNDKLKTNLEFYYEGTSSKSGTGKAANVNTYTISPSVEYQVMKELNVGFELTAYKGGVGVTEQKFTAIPFIEFTPNDSITAALTFEFPTKDLSNNFKKEFYALLELNLVAF